MIEHRLSSAGINSMSPPTRRRRRRKPNEQLLLVGNMFCFSDNSMIFTMTDRRWESESYHTRHNSDLRSKKYDFWPRKIMYFLAKSSGGRWFMWEGVSTTEKSHHHIFLTYFLPKSLEIEKILRRWGSVSSICPMDPPVKRLQCSLSVVFETKQLERVSSKYVMWTWFFSVSLPSDVKLRLLN